MQWPTPTRFSSPGLDGLGPDNSTLDSLGYDSRVIFPLHIVPKTPNAPIFIKGIFSYLVCATICVPAQGEIALTIPTGAAMPSHEAHRINRFVAQIPLVDPPSRGILMKLPLQGHRIISR